MADGVSRGDFRHLEALLEEASMEAERTVKHLRNRTRTDFRLWILVVAGWALAALGWTLFLASHFGYLEKESMLDLFKVVENKASDDFSSRPCAVPDTPLQLCDEVLTSSHARKLSSSSSSSASHESHDSDSLIFLFSAIVISVVILYATTFKMFSGLQHTVTLFIVGVVYSLILEIDSTYTKLGMIGRSHEMWMGIDPHLLLFTMLPALLTADAMTINTSIAFRVAKQCVYLAGPGVLFNAAMTALFLWVYLPYNWSFMLCLTTGAILCATDPVAVVALLKELGASPTLTVQIQGESLLNDGTAIVLYMISYNILKGEKYDFTDVVVFMVKTAMCAWALGMFVGMLFLEWIRYANRKLEHNSSLIQCTLTLCCAYWSFILAEGVFSISGVLSCVAASLVLAHKMWPAIVDKEFLHTIWHMFEYLGNTVIFFLAGALTGRTMVHIPGADYLHLFVIYIVLILVRGTLFFVSRPILRILGPDKEPVPVADCLVMVWGGLRGAVGLSLAIQVNTDRAEGEISAIDGQRVLFYVSGVAALTLLINATTCPLLVQRLGITQLPGAKKQMLRLLVQRLRHLSNERPHCGIVTKTIACMLDDVDHHMKGHGRSSMASSEEEDPSVKLDETFFNVTAYESNNDVNSFGGSEGEVRKESKPTSSQESPRVSSFDNLSMFKKTTDAPVKSESPQPSIVNKTASDGTKLGTPRSTERMKIFLKATNAENDDDFTSNSPRGTVPEPDPCKSFTQLEGFKMSKKKIMEGVQNKLKVKRKPLPDGQRLATDFKSAKAGVTAIKFLKIADNNFTEITRDLPKISFTLREQEEDLLHICRFLTPDKDLQRVFVEVFLKLVCADYWKQIGSGTIPNQKDGEILLLTVTLALSKGDAELWDFRFLREWIQSGSLVPKAFKKTDSADKNHHAPQIIQRFYKSYFFNIFIIIMIFVSAAAVWIEEAYLEKGDDFYHHKSFWFTLEVYFLVIFVVEFVFKFWDLRCQYFKDVLNNFDFLLIFIGLFGLLFTQLYGQGESGGVEQAQDVSQQGRLVRGARLFRVLRLMRILRIFRLLEYVKDRVKMKKEVHSKDVSCHMQKVMMLRAFVHAHIRAQENFLHIFCKDEQVETAEISRVLVDSMTSVNLAIAEAVQVEQSVDKKLLTQVRLVRECTDIAEHLEKFIYNAHEGGVITSKEAESIMHPLHHHLENFYRQLRRTQKGISLQPMKQELHGGRSTIFNEAPPSIGGDFCVKGSIITGILPVSLSTSPRDLFSIHTVEDKLDAKSRGWRVLQKAFQSRHESSEDAQVWSKMMRGGTRLSRRKSEFRARQRRMSEMWRFNFCEPGRQPSKRSRSKQSSEPSPGSPTSSVSQSTIQTQGKRVNADKFASAESCRLAPHCKSSSAYRNNFCMIPSQSSQLSPLDLDNRHSRGSDTEEVEKEIMTGFSSEATYQDSIHHFNRSATAGSLTSRRQVGFSNEAIAIEDVPAPGMLPDLPEVTSEIHPGNLESSLESRYFVD